VKANPFTAAEKATEAFKESVAEGPLAGFETKEPVAGT